MERHPDTTPVDNDHDKLPTTEEWEGKKGGATPFPEDLEDYVVPEEQEKEWQIGDQSPDDFDET